MKISKMEWIFVGTILLILSLIVYIPLKGIYIKDVRDGRHNGYITAIQSDYWGNYKVFFKTDLESSQEDTYCIRKDNPELLEEARDSQKSRDLVTLKYEGYVATAIGDCSNQIILGIEK